MGGAHMTVYLPYSGNFDIVNENIESNYKQILEHRYNEYSHEMAPTFADQQKGEGEYIVEFDDAEPSATIKRRHMRSDKEIDDSLAALHALTD
jgi:hypothetical protein